MTAEAIPLADQRADDPESGAGWGITAHRPPGDYTLVAALQPHIYVEAARGLHEKVRPGMVYWMETERVEANAKAGLVHASPKRACGWWEDAHRVLGVEPGADVAEPYAAGPSDGALRIASGCGYDPGSAAFRFHSAINEHTKHAMAFVRWGDNNPHCSLRQYDGVNDLWAVRDAVQRADVLHNHVGYWLLNNTGVRQRDDQLLVRHYHGSAKNGRSNLEPLFDKAKRAVVLGARLQLIAEAASFDLPMEWCPIPMPVARYRAWRDRVRREMQWEPLVGPATPARPFVVAHTPTNMRIKGTDVFRRVMQTLRDRKVPVASRLIHGVSLREAIARQAASDATFDSFWLGIQGSGLQAAAMEMPVVAGDHDNRVLYEVEFGAVPYTFANDEAALADQIERLAMDPTYRSTEASRVARYAESVHDYAAVARRYEATLARALGRPDVLTHPSHHV
jgi:hypothetical protein